MNRKTSTGLGLIVLAGIILRTIAAVMYSGSIGSEGAEYARLAENVLAGIGYSGIVAPGKQLFFPPLFPLLIAGASLVTRDIEIAGRAVSVFAGSLLVVPVFFIAAKVYGRRTGMIAAALACVHPFSIFMSIRIFSEMTFLTLLFAGIAFGFYAIQSTGVRRFVWCGLFLGLADLVRPEAVVHLAVSLIVLAVGMWDLSGRIAWRRILIPVVVFGIVVAPYVAWLSGQLGRLRLEAKSPLNLTADIRMARGERLEQAAYGVDSLGHERGVWNQTNAVVIQESAIGFTDLVAHARRKAPSVLTNTARAAVDFAFGGPPLFALAAIGLFCWPWSRSMTLFQFQLLSVGALTILATFFIYYNGGRFYVALVPLYAIWGAAGIQGVRKWTKQTALRIKLPEVFHRRPPALAAAAAFAISVSPSALTARDLFDSERSERALKSLGKSLRPDSGERLRLLASRTMVSFHAAAEHVWLPYCNEATALDYIRSKGIDILALETWDIGSRPYAERWIRQGVPSPDIVPLRAVPVGRTDTVYLFRVKK